MLPDFFSLKRQMQKRVDRAMQQIIMRESGFVDQIPRTRIFEGHRNKIIASDGTVIQDNEFHEETVTFQIEAKLLESISPEEVHRRLMESAKSMATAQKKYFFETMGKLMDEAGTSVNAGGRKFSIDLFLQGLEKIDLDFNPDGTPMFPTLVMHPSMQQTAYEELKKLETEPDVKERYEKIIQRKRDEWTARENDRQLVG